MLLDSKGFAFRFRKGKDFEVKLCIVQMENISVSFESINFKVKKWTVKTELLEFLFLLIYCILEGSFFYNTWIYNLYELSLLKR